jgi:hypothetical protein
LVLRGGTIVQDAQMTDDDIDDLVKQFSEIYDPLITVEEAVRIARLPSAQTLYDWSSRGLLDPFKVKCGRRVLFKRDAFVRFIAGAAGEAPEARTAGR